MVAKQGGGSSSWGRLGGRKKPPRVPGARSVASGEEDAIAAADEVAKALAKRNYDPLEGSFDQGEKDDDRYRMLRTVSTLSSFSRHQYLPRNGSMAYSINTSPSTTSNIDPLSRNPSFGKNRSYNSQARQREILDAKNIKREPPPDWFPAPQQHQKQQQNENPKHLTSELRAYKKEVKEKLRQFDVDFRKKHGRMPTEDEKEPVRYLYEMYNIFKDELALRGEVDEAEWAPGPAVTKKAPVREISVDNDSDTQSSFSDTWTSGLSSQPRFSSFGYDDGPFSYSEMRDDRISPRRTRTSDRNSRVRTRSPIRTSQMKKRQPEIPYATSPEQSRARSPEISRRQSDYVRQPQEKNEEGQNKVRSERRPLPFLRRSKSRKSLQDSKSATSSKSNQSGRSGKGSSFTGGTRSTSPGPAAHSISGSSSKSKKSKNSLFSSMRARSKSTTTDKVKPSSSFSLRLKKKQSQSETSYSSKATPPVRNRAKAIENRDLRPAPHSPSRRTPKERPLSPTKSILLTPKYSRTYDTDDQKKYSRTYDTDDQKKATSSKQIPSGRGSPFPLRRSLKASNSSHNSRSGLVPENYDVEIGVDGAEPVEKSSTMPGNFPPQMIEFRDLSAGQEFCLAACGLPVPRMLRNEKAACQSTIMNCSDDAAPYNEDSAYRKGRGSNKGKDGAKDMDQMSETTYDFFDKVDAYLSWDRKSKISSSEESDAVSELSFIV